MKREVFVEREFAVRRGKTAATLVLRVYRPTRRKTGEFACGYAIREGRTTLREFAMCGEDSLQALVLALSVVDIEIDTVLRQTNGKIARTERRDLRRLRPRMTRR